MWDAISSVLTSNNGVTIAILLVIILIIVGISAKAGLFYFKGTKLKIGQRVRQNEREVLQKQLEYAHTFIESRISLINHDVLRYDGYMAKYILEIAYDEVVNWIMFNHMSMDPTYISNKQKIIKHKIYGIDGVSTEFKTTKFRQTIDSWVEELIDELLKIRMLYNKTEL